MQRGAVKLPYWFAVLIWLCFSALLLCTLHGCSWPPGRLLLFANIVRVPQKQCDASTFCRDLSAQNSGQPWSHPQQLGDPGFTRASDQRVDKLRSYRSQYRSQLGPSTGQPWQIRQQSKDCACRLGKQGEICHMSGPWPATQSRPRPTVSSRYN